MPKTASRPWYADIRLASKCSCGHDAGAHGSQTSACTRCNCRGFLRPEKR